MNRETAKKLLDAYSVLCDVYASIPDQKTSQPLLKRVKEDVGEASELVKEAIAAAFDEKVPLTVSTCKPLVDPYNGYTRGTWTGGDLGNDGVTRPMSEVGV